ncbi:AmmeMemoRadiSam system protein A [Butyrivibrio proteoclasticus]|uniref:AmmeMemoRadiSam system protein A n=1 Tax=Butyrivibrio proteoclasticus TaxID=43305 RepID=UPI00047D4DDA|nr:AmmeMemoRadiSam system protein A [Butyrivibrio proteoclasticus]
MPVLATFMVPHPPLIVPEIGRGSEKQVQETITAYEQVADEIAKLAPETILVTSPHATMYADYFSISSGNAALGSFANFGAGGVKFLEEYDSELIGAISDKAKELSFPAGTLGNVDKELDHGTMVPLWFIRRKYKGGKLVRIGLSGLPLTDHYRLGMIIKDAIEATGRNVVIVASGDLSHKLQDYGPYGYAVEGPVYDQKIMDVCSRGAFGELFDFDENFCEKAAECGHRSFVIMAGTLDGMKVIPTKLSHQDVTGVGYGICTFYPTEPDKKRCFLDSYLKAKKKELMKSREKSDPYVQLAYQTVENYIAHKKTITVPAGLPEEMLENRAGVFVSIHKHDKLRGCIGTIGPTTENIASEIIQNAVSASTRDPRFDPITLDELNWLEISVDVLAEPEDIDSMDQLDVKRYGVIVTSGMKRGLLLPNLDGVDTVEEQVEIAKRKGGISDYDKISLQRFEVVRHY